MKFVFGFKMRDVGLIAALQSERGRIYTPFPLSVMFSHPHSPLPSEGLPKGWLENKECRKMEECPWSFINSSTSTFAFLEKS